MLSRSILAVLLLALWAAPAWAADIPSVSDAELEAALSLGGSNRAQLEQALFACQQKPFTMAAMRFLIVSLPLADLGAITRDELVQHVELAMQARAEFPYSTGAAYDDATWAHYVLPPRMSQEPLSAWRPFFLGELRDVVKDCPTLQEAAAKVNAWCGARVTFKQTQARDQGPLATLKSGYGRCEEMVIFYVDACRSVGIPTRQAYCPYWAVMDNNHAWAEVYGSDGRWHFTGGCEPRPTMDDAWFGQTARNAPLIVSVCFGLPGTAEPGGGAPKVDESGEEVLSVKDAPGARFCLINSTPFYRHTGKLIVEGGSGKLSVYVFNFGALRLIARVDFDGSSVVGVTLGAGTYALSCTAAEGPKMAVVDVKPDVETKVAWQALSGIPENSVLSFPADPAT
jgi:hypothetical protein